MFLEIFLAVIIGISLGVFTGLIPGIHVNLITSLVVSSVAYLSGINIMLVAVGIVSMALTHSFLDSIPSMYLGAPDPVYASSVLPGHQLLHEGKGYQAIVYTIMGSFFGLMLTLLLFPFGLWYLSYVSEGLTPYIGIILLAAIIFILYKSGDMLKNGMFLLASGGLGLLVFALPSQDQVLLPLLSGLFGTSTLLFSLLSVTSLPKQNTSIITVASNPVLDRTVGVATIIGVVAAFLPGFGASQGAIVGISTLKKPEPKDYLLLTGALNTVAFAFSLVTFTVLEKARNGAIVGVGELVGSFQASDLWIFGAVLLMVGGVATLLGLFFAKKLLVILRKVSYKHLVHTLLTFLSVLVLILSGTQGVLILLSATGLGLLTQFYGAQRNMLLGCLLIPVLMYFL